MATCDELALQLSGLQSQLADLEYQKKHPDEACADQGLTGDACILYIKSLGGLIDSTESEIAGVQRQQYLQGCLGQQVITGTLSGQADLNIDTDPKNPYANETFVSISATLTFIGNPGSSWDVALLSLAPIQVSGASINFTYNGGTFDAAHGTMSLSVTLDAKVLEAHSTVTLDLVTKTVQDGPYSPEGLPFDKTAQTISLAGAGQFTGGKFNQNYTSILIDNAQTSNWPQS